MLRTHTCGELRSGTRRRDVTLCGWVDTYRDHSGVLFSTCATATARPRSSSPRKRQRVGRGWPRHCERIRDRRSRAKWPPRPEGTVNPKLATGEIELRARQAGNPQQEPHPAASSPAGKELPGEDLRLKYRYLDLRRPEMQQTLLLRHRMIEVMRDYFDELGFLDVETPMLGRSTPEGARDYLVPSRIQHGHVLRPAAIAAALQANPDGRRLRPLRAGRPLLPRRRPAGRSPAGVHAVRRGDVVHRRRGHYRRHRRAGGPAGQGDPGPRGASCRCRG